MLSKEYQMARVAGELESLKKVISYLWDGEQEAFAALYFVKSNYKEWPQMIKWLKDNNLRGKRLVEFFQNESPSGKGYHLGALKIFNQIKGNKNYQENMKVSDLL